ncbi:hypothetical protein CDS [Bradyrhizobium sp.]|nr:hypothetical protein CDS [Bradyrhizobium sp.]
MTDHPPISCPRTHPQFTREPRPGRRLKNSKNRNHFSPLDPATSGPRLGRALAGQITSPPPLGPPWWAVSRPLSGSGSHRAFGLLRCGHRELLGRVAFSCSAIQASNVLRRPQITSPSRNSGMPECAARW